MLLNIENRSLDVKNLEKVYFEEQGYKKADILDYYVKIAPYLLPHLVNRPFSMIHFPGGKLEDSFFQKQCPVDAPPWLNTVKIPSERRGHIDWCTVNDLPSLVYMVNKSVIEMHAWFSRADNLDKPDAAVLDLDPSGESGIKEAAVIAAGVGDILKQLSVYSVPKTSGGRGLHIFIPITPNKYTYADVQKFLGFLCGAMLKYRPDICTSERAVSKRGDKIYLDAVQCGRGKTIAMPYSLRVKSGALVSAPLNWNEINANLNPRDYNIRSIWARLEKQGDIMSEFYNRAQDLPEV